MTIDLNFDIFDQLHGVRCERDSCVSAWIKPMWIYVNVCTLHIAQMHNCTYIYANASPFDLIWFGLVWFHLMRLFGRMFLVRFEFTYTLNINWLLDLFVTREYCCIRAQLIIAYRVLSHWKWVFIIKIRLSIIGSAVCRINWRNQYINPRLNHRTSR